MVFPKIKELLSLFGEKKNVSSKKGLNASYYKPLMTWSYDGEKNLGELGPVVKYNLEYNSLRHRSWKAFLDDKVTRTAISRYVTWIIGSGLKLQSEPEKLVLQTEGLNADLEEFTDVVEARFKVWARSKHVDFYGRKNLNQLASVAYKNSLIGGDVLVILSYKSGKLKVRLIDGAHIQTPFGTQDLRGVEQRGNSIENGIEINSKGVHVAYWVKQKDFSFKRVLARGERTKREQAFLVYGLEYRIDNHRGIPLISTVLETLAKLDRYQEATVSSAEERAKIPYTIEHKEFSDGENPMIDAVSQSFNYNGDEPDLPTDISGKELAKNISVTTNKQVFNMPQGASLKSLDTKSDVNFKDFYDPNVNAICSTIGIPPEVALSQYNSNFSSSRAALKDWEHTILVNREDFTQQFYKKILAFWLDIEVLQNKIQAPGYLKFIQTSNFMGLEAYRTSRFIGSTVPHIDPVKEVKAERLKLGENSANVPLTTFEAATESLNGGDYKANLQKYSSELDMAESEGVVLSVDALPEIPEDNQNG